MMLVLVAVVATVLPAVAVADVMVVGYAGGNGHQIGPAFYIQPGSNYAAANETVGFGWHAKSVSESEIIGNMTLGVMTNETIYEINVLDINFTFSSPQSATFNITVNVPSAVPGATTGDSAWPSGTYIYFSTTPFYFADGAISNSGTMKSVNLATSGTHTISFTDVTSSTTIYVAFAVGSGSIGSGSSAPSFSLTMVETAS
ncbi:hypothetical protein [Thermoplasma acidophilum]|uniref:Uncharacterized protein n=2 Tax=Thermoplasma acidophilum TaxID=2303 RepID=Q9HL51_THEAC|nr:hypothetical protein [Thermoplasma acidophilum]